MKLPLLLQLMNVKIVKFHFGLIFEESSTILTFTLLDPVTVDSERARIDDLNGEIRNIECMR